MGGSARLGYPLSSIHSETVAKCHIVLPDSETRHARETNRRVEERIADASLRREQDERPVMV